MVSSTIPAALAIGSIFQHVILEAEDVQALYPNAEFSIPIGLVEWISGLALVHVAGTFNHNASSDLRYIIDPPGSTARVHQHMDVCQEEIDWEAFFKTVAK